MSQPKKRTKQEEEFVSVYENLSKEETLCADLSMAEKLAKSCLEGSVVTKIEISNSGMELVVDDLSAKKFVRVHFLRANGVLWILSFDFEGARFNSGSSCIRVHLKLIKNGTTIYDDVPFDRTEPSDILRKEEKIIFDCDETSANFPGVSAFSKVVGSVIRRIGFAADQIAKRSRDKEDDDIATEVAVMRFVARCLKVSEFLQYKNEN